jgi:hypothetical protein
MATQNNEDSFPADRPELSDTESYQEGKILETHAITTTVHEMKVKGFHLVKGKQETLAGLDLVDPKASDSTPKMTLIHYRSIISTDDPLIDDRCYVVQENITEDEVIRTEGKKYLDQNETEMTQEELQKFEEDWSKLWKPFSLEPFS